MSSFACRGCLPGAVEEMRRAVGEAGLCASTAALGEVSPGCRVPQASSVQAELSLEGLTKEKTN